MTETPDPSPPPSEVDPAAAHVEPRVTAQAETDVRVAMVLAVLGGRPVEDVALEWDVEVSLLHRWVRDFLVAGSGVVTHQPDPETARQRERFLAAFAHELRTPVAVARGWAMLLAEGDVPEEEMPESLGRLVDALTRLSEHILDVELAATASLGRIPVRREVVVVSGLCQELVGRPAVREGADLSVYADPRLLRRVLRDLWRTAHREPDPDSVAIDVVETGSWHEIRVVRQGIPIGPMVVKALFDPFDANDDATGVTIGLYMARALTVVQGGYLGAEGDDERTVLLVRLPREPEIDPEPPGPGSSLEEEGEP